MALALNEQITKTIEGAKTILITFKKHFNGDTLSSSIALKSFLEKQGKKVDVASGDFILPAQYKFLNPTDIQTTIDSLRQFVISFDLAKTPLKDFSYNVENDQLKIYLTPKKGVFKTTDFTTESGSYKYDLIITIDTEDLASLGSMFTENQDFFHQTTIINIDHKPENEQYGQINFIDLNVTSISELLFNYFSQTNLGALDAALAQNLLTGIICKTHSFKSPKVTPTTLMIASQLMKAGANRDEIIKNIYYTKSIETLKLWGKVLSRLKAESGEQIAWSFVEDKDFKDLNVTPEKLDEVIEELIVTAPEAKIIVIFYQYNNVMHGIVYADSPLNAAELVTNHNPFGSKRYAMFSLNHTDLQVAAKEVIEEVKVRTKK